MTINTLNMLKKYCQKVDFCSKQQKYDVSQNNVQKNGMTFESQFSPQEIILFGRATTGNTPKRSIIHSMVKSALNPPVVSPTV